MKDERLTVASAVGFPTGGNFRIIIDSEIMLVTDVQGKTFTVTPAQEGTSAASHNAAAGVFHVLTAGSLAQRDIEQFATGLITARDTAGQTGRLYLPNPEGLVHQDDGTHGNMLPFHRLTPPAAASFSWVNQGTSTAVDTKGMLVLTPQSTAGGDSLRCLVKAAPATPYEITVAMLAVNPTHNQNSTIAQFGICWRDSVSQELLTYGWMEGNYPLNFSYSKWTNATTLSVNVFNYSTISFSLFWIKFSDDGNNRNVKISHDGINWELAQAPQGRTVFLTADQVGIFANAWMLANSYQTGIPDLFCYHAKWGTRWIEVKRPVEYTFTRRQRQKWPEWERAGIGIWILTAATQEQYDLLFQPPNWRDFWRPSFQTPTAADIDAMLDELDHEDEQPESSREQT